GIADVAPPVASGHHPAKVALRRGVEEESPAAAAARSHPHPYYTPGDLSAANDDDAAAAYYDYVDAVWGAGNVGGGNTTGNALLPFTPGMLGTSVPSSVTPPVPAVQ